MGGGTVVSVRDAAELCGWLDSVLDAISGGSGKAQEPARAAAGARVSIPDVRVEVLPTATHHTLPLDPAAEVNRALVAFLSG